LVVTTDGSTTTWSFVVDVDDVEGTNAATVSRLDAARAHAAAAATRTEG
jgi:hypothetical protein